MSRRGPIPAKKWLRVGLIALAMAVGTYFARYSQVSGDPQVENAVWTAVCDALFVPGILLLCAGLLVVVSSGGAFDALSFGTQKLISLVRSEEKRNELPKTYYDYVEARHAKEKADPRALLMVGGGMTLLAVIALMIG